MTRSNGTPEQLIPVGWVADSLGVPPVKVVNTAKATVAWFDGSLAVTFSEAARIVETVRAEQVKLDAEYIAQFDRDRQAVAEMEEAARKRAAAKPRSRIIRGVETFGPGDPEPSWTGGDA